MLGEVRSGQGVPMKVGATDPHQFDRLAIVSATRFLL